MKPSRPSRARQKTRRFVLSDAQERLLDRGIGPQALGLAAGATKQAASLWLRGQTTPSEDFRIAIARSLGVPLRCWRHQPGCTPPVVNAPGYMLVDVESEAQAAALIDELGDDGIGAALEAWRLLEVYCSTSAEREAVAGVLRRDGLRCSVPTITLAG